MWPSTLPRAVLKHVKGKRLLVPVPRYVEFEREKDELDHLLVLQRRFNASSPPQKHHNAHRAAKGAAEADVTDPFAYRRAYSRMLNGNATPDDFRKGGRG